MKFNKIKKTEDFEVVFVGEPDPVLINKARLYAYEYLKNEQKEVPKNGK